MSDEQVVEPSGTTRRRFVQAAAAAGVIGAVWSEPIIRGSVAGAQTGVSVDGSCTGAFITWSGGMDTWLSMGSNAATESISGSGATAMGTFTWNNTVSVCMTLTSSVIVQAVGNAEAGTEAGGATVTITTGASCNFGSVVPASGNANPTSGPTFMLWNVPATGMTQITFNILC